MGRVEGERNAENNYYFTINGSKGAITLIKLLFIFPK